MHGLPGCAPPADFPGIDPSSSAAWHAWMRTLHAYRRLMSRALGENKVPPGQIFALREIGHCDGVTQRDLAEKLRISRPTLTVMLQKMEKSGLIERSSDESDHRFTRLHLTASGTAEHERMHGFMGAVVTQAMGPLSEADRDELARLLTLVNDNITTALQATPSENQDDA
jgi:DNA-binding MarR family transcriptional regulator